MPTDDSSSPTDWRGALKQRLSKMPTRFRRGQEGKSSLASQPTENPKSMGTQTSAVSSTDWPRDGEKVLMSCPCPTIMNKPSSDWFPSQADRTADFAQSVPSLEHAGRSIAPISDFDLEDDGFTYQVSVKLDSSLKFPTGSGEEPQPSVIGLSSCATPEGIRLRTSVAGKWYRNAETKPCENNGVPGKCFSYRAANHPLSVDVKRYPKPESQIGKWSRDTRAVDSVFQIGVLPDNGEWRPFVRDYWLPDGSQSNGKPPVPGAYIDSDDEVEQ